MSEKFLKFAESLEPKPTNSNIMEQIIAKIKEQLAAISADIDKNTKASEARVRKATIELEKLGKEYRKASIAARK